MSKKKSTLKYFDPISDDELSAQIEKLKKMKSANRKKALPKIEPVIPTVLKCLSADMSSRKIKKIVMEKHRFSIGKDAILRFAAQQKSMKVGI